MPNKSERFTTAARAVLVTAESEAYNLKHEFVGPEHLLLGVVRVAEGGAARILQDLIDKERISEIVGALPSTPTRAAGTRPELSEGTKKVLEIAVSEAARLHHNFVDTEHLLMGLVLQADNTVVEVLKDLDVSLEKIKERFEVYQQASQALGTYSVKSYNWTTSQSHVIRTPLVDQLTTDLVLVALDHSFDPLVKRDAELDRMMQILSSRSKNRLLLVGQPGIGKTTLVHGLIGRIIRRDVPVPLRNRRVLLLDPVSLIAGTTRLGQFEERFARVLEELRASTDIILFVDDAFDAVLTGLDMASTLLALAGTGIPFIHAAATDNYEKYLKPNMSLMSAFVALIIQELSPEDTLKALYAHRPIYQEYYDITIDDDAIEAAARLANPYLKTGVQPDKSIQLLDEAASAFVWRQERQPEQQGKAHLTRQDVLIVLSQITGLSIDQLK